ncbi:DUF488 domain-containing protein [Metabacillus bambusae]|uniref:DUF488 family protein n=1 Tax=Metabacillus bambusae TaxID=2795218 RepID=A0ABS3N428_9BACI|nr:DUF488 family protein [Metabacillus bambusae]MBO1512648.1 DUF488 family protein [Metabacillus bambusae]
MPVTIKRIYDEVCKDDGVRVLVDRLWPRGLAREKVKIDYWMKHVAPSTHLRKWFYHDPVKFCEFKERYIEELMNEKEKNSQLEELKNLVAENRNVTLIYSAKDQKHNQAVVLKEILERQKKTR